MEVLSFIVLVLMLLFCGGCGLALQDAGGGAERDGAEGDGDGGEDGDAGGGDDRLELTAEERTLISETRQRRLPAAQVLRRAARDYQRERADKTGQERQSDPDPTAIPTRAEVDAAVEAKLQAARQQEETKRREAEVRAELDAVMDRVIEGDARFKGASPAKREQLRARANRIVMEDPAVNSMNAAEIKAGLAKATAKAMAEELAEAARLTGGTEEELEHRLKAAASTPGGAGGRSAGSGSSERPSSLTLEHYRPGDPGVNWAVTDAEVEADTQRAADEFLRKETTGHGV